MTTKALSERNELTGATLVGKNVETPYGVGVVSEYRSDAMYVVKLTNEIDSTMAVLYSADAPKMVRTRQEQSDESKLPAEMATITPEQEQADESKLPAEMATITNEPAPEDPKGPVHYKKKDAGPALVGKHVGTPYGIGVVLEYRQCDETYAVKLTNENSYSAMAILYTRDAPKKIKTKQEEVDELNVAYEALEKMRRMNMEMECFEAGVFDEHYADHCTTCLINQSEEKTRFPRLQNFVDNANSARASESNSFRRFPRLQNLVDSTTTSTESAKFPRIRSLWGSNSTAKKKEPPKKSEPPKKTVVLPRIQKFMDKRQKASASPCLICASPSCSVHASPIFRKEGITLCLSCEKLFELNFIVDCVSNPDAAERAKHIEHMIDRYDRCLLLLMYSTQFVDQIAESLGQQKEQQNKIGLGSSGVGAFSGVLGIAAACTILTPVGPPLLIASVLFGGSATAVQTGTEAMNYFSEPNKLADRIIALHGMVLSILRVTSTLRDAMLRDHIRTDGYEADPTPLSAQAKKKIEENKLGVLYGANFGRSVTLGGVATLEVGAVAGVEGVAVAGAGAGARGAAIMSRAGTAAARTIRFARFAGGALSAAVLVLEANAIQSTLKDMHEGSPCQKANRIKEIAKEIKEELLPSTSALDEECQAYLNALSNRPTPMEDVAAVSTDAPADHFPEAECKVAPENEDLCTPGAVIVDGEGSGVVAMPSESQSRSQVASIGGSSLLQRIQRHQDRRRQRSDGADEVVAVVLEGGQTRDTELNLVL